MSLIIHAGDLQSVLGAYHASNELTSRDLEGLRRDIMKSFEEDDKRRGVPYLKRTEQVSEDYLIQYIGVPSFSENEEVTPDDGLDASLFDDEDDDSEGDSEGIDEVTGELDGKPQTSYTLVPPPGALLHDDDEFDDVDDSEDDIEDSEDDYSEATSTEPTKDTARFDSEYFNVLTDISGYDDWVSFYQKESDERLERLRRLAQIRSSEIPSPSSVEPENSESAPVTDAHDPGVKVARKMLKRPQSSGEGSRSHAGGSKHKKPTKSGTLPSKGGIKGTAKPSSADPSRSSTRAQRPRKKPFEDAFDGLFSDITESLEAQPQDKKRRPTPRVSPSVEANYRSLRELIKNNPGCSVEFATKHFPKREIQKEIKLGKVFLKNGKLSV